MTELDDKIDAVAKAAQAARGKAYAPYSDFPMGAAVLTADGVTIPGALVENVSLGLAMCAERVALFTAVTQVRHPVILALCSKRTNDELTFPCGACLQVALEIGGTELIVVATDPDGAIDHSTVAELLTRAPKRHSPSAAPK
ncbi:MAG: cytidine deaminase [Acidimicrobiales bacterium]|nr:cytidine deaminase [Acidimicrobiales bacterium]